VRQYGRVPEARRRIRFSQYRHGGGVAGNVPAGKIEVLKSAIPYIDRVTNLSRAEGGRDQESLEEAKMRAARELRAQQRAVTAEDYENLAISASRAVARVKCRTPGSGAGALPPGMVELLVAPAAFEAVKANDFAKLQVDQALQRTIEAHLDRYRLLTTTLQIREPNYLGVKVQAEIVISEYSRPEIVRARVIESLRNLITPLAMNADSESPAPLPDMPANWEGWPFGRDLYVAELYSLIQQVPGVKHVLDIELSRRKIVPGKASPAGPEGTATEEALTPVTERVLQVPEDTLLCSLEHEIEIVEL
jgi:predicted phage baseplate assembly protein